MALALTQLIANSNNVDQASYTTATLTPVANQPVLAAVSSTVASGAPNQPTLSGAGLTWVAITSISGGSERVTIFIGRGTASPSPSAVTIDFAAQTQTGCEWGFYDVAGGRVTDESIVKQFNSANVSSGATSISQTLASGADKPTSRAFAANRHNANEAVTPRASWTTLSTVGHGSPAGTLHTEWRSDAFEGTASASWTTAGQAKIVVVELLGPLDATVAPPAAAATAAAPAPTVTVIPPTTVAPPAATADAVALAPALTVHTLPPLVDSGWGSAPWGTFPWGPTAIPGFDRRAVPYEDFPGELPPLEHVIIGPGGAVDQPPVVHGFTADEDVGFATLAGAVEIERVRDQPDIYRDGAQWVVVDSSTGHLVAGGDLLDPVIGAGMAGIKADGWAKRLQRHGERLLYATRGYGSLFVPKNSEPFGPNGRGFYVHGEDKFQVDTTGALRWKSTKGNDAWSADDVQGFVAYFGGLRPGVRRITGHLHSTVDGVNFVIRANTTPDQVTPPSPGSWVTLHDFTPAGKDADFDVDMPVSDPVLIIEAQRTSGGSAVDLEITLTNLVIYGIASSEDWTGSDVARDIAGRLGFATDIEDSGFPVLPIDAGPDGVYQDPLDVASVLSGSFYRVTGRRPAIPVLEWHPLGSSRWVVLDPEFPVEPVPLPRFDSVLVPYTLSNGVAQDVMEITAESVGAEPLPVSRAYGPVSLPDPAPDATNAAMLGQQILRLVYAERCAGTVTFSRVASPDGGFVSGHLVHSYDALTVPMGGGTEEYTMPTKALARSGGAVQVTFDDGIAAVDRLVARKSRQILLKNPK